MATLEQLLNDATAYQLRSPDQLRAREQEIIDATLPAYMRQSGATAQQQAESNFNRGMGLSTYAAYQAALNDLMQREGVANIANQAKTSTEQAQNAAIAQAAGQVNADKNRATQQSIAAGNQTVSRQLQKMRGNQAITNALIGGAGNIGAGVGGMLAKGLTAKPGSGNTLSELYGNAKANLGFGAPAAMPSGGEAMSIPDLSLNGTPAVNVPDLGGDFSFDSDFSTGPAYPSDLSLDMPAYSYTDPGSWGFSLQDLLGSLGSGAGSVTDYDYGYF